MAEGVLGGLERRSEGRPAGTGLGVAGVLWERRGDLFVRAVVGQPGWRARSTGASDVGGGGAMRCSSLLLGRLLVESRGRQRVR